LWVYSTGHVRQIVRGQLANDQEAMLLEYYLETASELAEDDEDLQNSIQKLLDDLA